MRLSKYQMRSLGIDKEELPQYIWNSRMLRIYSKLSKQNRELDEEGQTFHQFLEMEKQQPNEEGTGRYKFETIKEIQLIVIPKDQKKQVIVSKMAQSQIMRFILTYLRIPIKKNSQINLTVKNNCLFDKTKNIEYLVRYEEQGFNVYDLLDILMEYRKDNTILVGLIEAGLQQNGAILDGRACGDGVAIIGYNQTDLKIKFQDLLQTTLHETLHTLGFDHCIAWKCLMNGYTDFCSWLCPACSRKLYHEINLNTCGKVKAWMSEVLSLIQSLKFTKSALIGTKILKAISKE